MANTLDVENRAKAERQILGWLDQWREHDPINGESRYCALLRVKLGAIILGLMAAGQDAEAIRLFVNEMMPPPERSRPHLVIDNQPAA